MRKERLWENEIKYPILNVIKDSMHSLTFHISSVC
jgi:hypothetical protein